VDNPFWHLAPNPLTKGSRLKKRPGEGKLRNKTWVFYGGSHYQKPPSDGAVLAAGSMVVGCALTLREWEFPTLVCSIRKAKAVVWKDLCETIDKDPWGRPYKIIRKKAGNRGPPAHRDHPPPRPWTQS
jgi:hypothetical protein